MKNCDICKRPFMLVKYDAKTHSGAWANMCPSCFLDNTPFPHTLGVGLGQRYERKVGGEFVKTEG